ncbi:MAG: hypothetical protein U0795_15480 [Pirellulales bacterium]
MGRRASAELRELWAQRLERQAASGSSIAEFCAAEGISAGSFSSWKRRLRPAAEGVAPSGCRTGTMTCGSPNVSTGQFFQLPMVLGREHLSVDVELVDGTVIRVPAANFGAIELVLRTVTDLQTRTLTGGHSHA